MSVGFDTPKIVGVTPQPLKSCLKSQKSQPVESQKDRIQQLWAKSTQVRHTTIQSNHQRLYEIDPALVGKSRWGDSCIPNIFRYIGSVFSSWWNQKEIKTLQVANVILNDPALTDAYKTEKNWGSAATWAFTHSKVKQSDRKQVQEIVRTINMAYKLRITWADQDHKPLTQVKVFHLSKEERQEKQLAFRQGRQNELMYRQQRRKGVMEDDPRRKTGIFSPNYLERNAL